MSQIRKSIVKVKNEIYTKSKISCPAEAFTYSNVTKENGSMISKGVFQEGFDFFLEKKSRSVVY